MTTDFLITIKDQTGTTHVARTVKPSKELENERTIEKFEIERAYWESRGIDWELSPKRRSQRVWLKMWNGSIPLILKLRIYLPPHFTPTPNNLSPLFKNVTLPLLKW